MENANYAPVKTALSASLSLLRSFQASESYQITNTNIRPGNLFLKTHLYLLSQFAYNKFRDKTFLYAYKNLDKASKISPQAYTEALNQAFKQFAQTYLDQLSQSIEKSDFSFLSQEDLSSLADLQTTQTQPIIAEAQYLKQADQSVGQLTEKPPTNQKTDPVRATQTTPTANIKTTPDSTVATATREKEAPRIAQQPRSKPVEIFPVPKPSPSNPRDIFNPPQVRPNVKEMTETDRARYGRADVDLTTPIWQTSRAQTTTTSSSAKPVQNTASESAPTTKAAPARTNRLNPYNFISNKLSPYIGRRLGGFGPLGKALISRFGPSVFSGGIGGLVGGAIGGPISAAIGTAVGAVIPSTIKSGIATKAAGAFGKLGGKALAGKLASSLPLKALGLALGPGGWIATAVITFRKPLFASLKYVVLFILFLVIFMIPSSKNLSLWGPSTKGMPSNQELSMTGSISEPDTSDPNTVGSGKSTLDYSLPLRDTTVKVANPEALKKEVLQRFPKAQIQNWDIIVSESIKNGWNPAFLLTLWIEETGAQGVERYTDALGCDPSHPTTNILLSLNCVFKSFSGYSNDAFGDLMCRYGGDGFPPTAPCEFKDDNPNFPGNIKYWYSRLVPSGNGSMTQNQPTKPRGKPGSIPTGDLRAAIQNQFGITFNGFNDQQLQWAWTKLSDISITRFPNLIYGTQITATESMSEQLNCSSIKLNKPRLDNEELFNVVLLHELGHRAYWCNDDGLSRRAEHRNIYYAEGPVTGYGEPKGGTACYGTPAITEDYPEMLTYYLNPTATEQTVGPPKCQNRGQIPYANNRYPGHYFLAQKILGNY